MTPTDFPIPPPVFQLLVHLTSGSAAVVKFYTGHGKRMAAEVSWKREPTEADIAEVDAAIKHTLGTLTGSKIRTSQQDPQEGQTALRAAMAKFLTGGTDN